VYVEATAKNMAGNFTTKAPWLLFNALNPQYLNAPLLFQKE
jgi:hypothetical protein